MNRKELMQEVKPLRPPPPPPSANKVTPIVAHNNSAQSEYEQQALLIKDQDEDLEGLRESVERLGDMGKTINKELSGQESLIASVEEDIDSTSSRLDFVQKKVTVMIVKAGDKGQLFMIVFLIILLIVLVVLIIYA